MSNFLSTKRDRPCQICADITGRCREVQNSDLLLCMGFTEGRDRVPGFRFVGRTKDQQWGEWLPGNDRSSQEQQAEWRQQQQALRQLRQQQEQATRAAAMTAAERDRHYRKLLGQLTLHPVDRADLVRRGLSDEQIEAGGFKSVEQWQRLENALPWTLPGVNLDSYSLNTQAGYLCPIRDVDGLIVAFQVRLRNAEQGGRYRWLSSKTKKRPNGATAHLPNGENPIAVARPDSIEYGNIGMTEGVLKPFIAAEKLNTIVLGAAGGQFASSPQTLKATLDRLTETTFCGKAPSIVFYPDAGAIENKNVLRQYRETWKLLDEWGYHVLIAWWGQFTKGDRDIDELGDPYSQIKLFSVEGFWQLASNAKREQARAAIAKIQVELNSLTHEPTLRLNQQYLSDIHLPENGGYLFINSPMGTGKTTQLANLIAEYRSRHPQGKIRSIGHRNGLLRQAGAKLGVPLLVDVDFAAEHGKLTSSQISKLESCGLCINSLLRLDVDSLDGALLIFDEVDAILKSLLTSKLLKKQRAQIMAHLQRIVRHVLATGGYVIGMEASLTDLAIDSLRGIGGTEHPMQLVCNEWQGAPWDVTVYGNSGATWMLSVADFPGRQVVVTDSQKFGEELERLMRGSGKKVVRVDGRTAECGDIRAFLANPDEFIRQHKPDTLILSPTLESGGDIAIRGYFDRVAFCLCSLETRSQMQMLGRVREPIPRVGIIGSPGGSDEAGRSLNPDTIRDDLYRNAEALATFTQLAQVLEQQADSGDSEAKTYRDRLLGLLDPAVESPDSFWLDAYCKFRARENGARAAMAENLIAALEAAGHQVKLAELPKDKMHGEIRAKIREELERKESGQLASADGEKFSPSEARELLEKPGTTEEDRFCARKTILQDGLPGVSLTEDFIYRAAVQERGSFLKAATLLWQSQNIEIVKELDRRAFTRELEKSFVFVADLNTRSLKADLLNRSGLVDLIGDRVYTEDNEDVQKFKRWALWNRFEIKRLLGMTISDKQTAIAVFCKFARKLGYTLEACKKGGRGQQVRVYHIDNLEDADRDAILAALTRKYAELAQNQAKNVSSSDTVSTTFLSNKSNRDVATEMVDTGGGGRKEVDTESLADVAGWLATAAETGDRDIWQATKGVIAALGDDFKATLWQRLDRTLRAAVYRFEEATA